MIQERMISFACQQGMLRAAPGQGHGHGHGWFCSLTVAPAVTQSREDMRLTWVNGEERRFGESIPMLPIR
ncbi:uncharacterized protein ACLA_058600 [Aspergillus clavatus NRRL 1]|uniref:Uncharacterized protein n=1 Tax=Aspergillus clavatus (strain ATCC 1007 / CBS 513.65 / DSM 816 / NCTC 3887 / NRRL 1 / QM 1276 / 107) TaxID=344612 RepID=A1C458_ASPCL|nr:uncharacterized protein ACLA_058600 [Aspergillus clavatus NRRL 1]EAW15198.1 hypothetical protein ACLA_058600 [Aspergillus clavatus NRRL 1]